MRAGKRAALFARRDAAAKVQLRRENHFQPASQGIGHALEQRFGGSLTHLLGITADGGQVQAVFVDKRGIVKADDADILRHAAAHLLQLMHRACGHIVVADIGGGIIAPYQPLGKVLA